MDNITRYRKIKSELILRGISRKEIAEYLDVAPNSIYLVISGREVSRRIAEYIERMLGYKRGSLFPYVLYSPQHGPKKTKEAA